LIVIAPVCYALCRVLLGARSIRASGIIISIIALVLPLAMAVALAVPGFLKTLREDAGYEGY
jgi:hypothetical protein